MECRMITNASAEWTCQIKIRREIEDATGQKILSEQIEKPFGAPISHPPDVEQMLRRAQLAVLNPSVPSDDFVNYDLADLDEDVPPLNSDKQYSFTPNLVILEISGPRVLNLTFIDLPGAFSRSSSSLSIWWS